MYKVTLGLLALELIVTRISPHDAATWWMEVFPIFLVAPVVWHFGRRGALSPLLQVMIILHGAILALGGHYTYARVPLGDWIRDWGIGSRNNYDKLGHFAQGFVPVIAIREILMRGWFWGRQKIFIGILAVLACGGISALYEIVEMIAALIMGGGADDFLGTQGYAWDTQTDMATAMVGATVGILFLAGRHQAGIQAGKTSNPA